MNCPECGGVAYADANVRLIKKEHICTEGFIDIGRVWLYDCYECQSTFAVKQEEV